MRLFFLAIVACAAIGTLKMIHAMDPGRGKKGVHVLMSDECPEGTYLSLNTESGKKGGKRGSRCVEVETVVTQTIGVDGDTILLRDSAIIEFPPGAFSDDAIVKIEKIDEDTEARALFAQTADIFQASAGSTYTISVEIESMFTTPPAPTVILFIPQDLQDLTPPDSSVEVFARATQTSPNEQGPDAFDIFVDLPSTTFEAGPPNGLAIAFALYPALFKLDAITNIYKALFLMASTPGATPPFTPPPPSTGRVLGGSTNDECDTKSCPAASIRCPVDSGCTVVSGFKPVNRGDPTSHYGIDLQVNTGESIRSPADGIIAQAKDDDPLFRNYLILRHNDGSATRLSRLGAISVSIGQSVERGDILGTAVTNDDVVPVVHLEYAINGEFYSSKGLADPELCIGDDGSILIGDNGSLADDSFTLIIDGVEYGTTPLGKVKTLGVSGLKDGSHELTVVVAVAPDDVGTYFVELSDGWEFSDGSTRKDGAPPEGTRDDYTFIVPDGFNGGCVDGDWWRDTSAGGTCQDWIDDNIEEGTAWLDDLPDCPCQQAYSCTLGIFCTDAPEGWESLGKASQTYHPGASHCMRSDTSFYTTFASGQQCCYDSSGNLITGGYSAGTPDRFAAGFQPSGIRHWTNDVRPFDDCPCTSYLQYRPPNKGNSCAENIVFAC